MWPIQTGDTMAAQIHRRELDHRQTQQCVSRKLISSSQRGWRYLHKQRMNKVLPQNCSTWVGTSKRVVQLKLFGVESAACWHFKCLLCYCKESYSYESIKGWIHLKCIYLAYIPLDDSMWMISQCEVIKTEHCLSQGNCYQSRDELNISPQMCYTQPDMSPDWCVGFAKQLK